MGALAATAERAEAFLKGCNAVGPKGVKLVVAAERERARAELALRKALADITTVGEIED